MSNDIFWIKNVKKIILEESQRILLEALKGRLRFTNEWILASKHERYDTTQDWIRKELDIVEHELETRKREKIRFSKIEKELKTTIKALELAISSMYESEIIDTLMVDDRITRTEWEADRMQDLIEEANSILKRTIK